MALTADELAAQLGHDIKTGTLTPGEKLPSIVELVATRDIGRGAAQQALNKLRAQGLIESRQGSGNYVKKESGRIEMGGNWADALPPESSSRATILAIDEVPAPEFVATELGIALGEPVVMRLARVDRDGKPAHVEEVYFPADLARGTPLAYHSVGEGGIAARLADLGARPDRRVEYVVARAPLPSEAAALKLPASSPTVLEITRVIWSGKRPVQAARAVLNPRMYLLVYESVV
jgi:GntR family transcriptional regulator